MSSLLVYACHFLDKNSASMVTVNLVQEMVNGDVKGKGVELSFT